MVGNPETPGISPDTPDLEHSEEKLRVLIRILQKIPEIPDRSPDIPGFAEVWASGWLG